MDRKISQKKGKYISEYRNYAGCFVSCGKFILKVMSYVLLNAFYDAGNKVGNILAWVFILLMFIEVVYVMAKYLGPSKK